MRPVANRRPLVRRSRTVLAVLGIALFASSFEAAHAKGAKGKAHAPPKVAVPSFTGPGEATSRGAVEKALKSRKIVVVPGSEISGAAKRLKVRLDSNDGYKAVAKALNLTGFVMGEVTNKKATLTVRTGSDGSVVGEETFTGAGPKKIAGVISKTFWKRLSGAFNKTNPPGGGAFEAPPPEEEPASAAKEEPAEAEEKAPAESKPVAKNEGKSSKKKAAEEAPAASESAAAEKSESEGEGESKKTKASAEEAEPSEASPNEAVSLFVGPTVLMRSLSYHQQRPDLSATPTGSYSLPSAPALSVRADLFPAAFLGGGPLADLGLTGALMYLLPVVTSPGMGGNYKTVSTAWSFGLKYRLPLGLFATVAYGDDWFQLRRSSSSMSTSVVPSTDYKFARVGAGIHTSVSQSLVLDANLAYLQCIGKPGQIGGPSYFPRATCAGLEVGVGAGYKVTSAFEIRAGVDVRRFGLAFNVKPSDVMVGNPAGTPPIAGGALDQYIEIYVGLAYLMGGGASESSGGGAEAAPESKKSGDAKSGKGDDDDDGDDDKDDKDDKKGD